QSAEDVYKVKRKKCAAEHDATQRAELELALGIWCKSPRPAMYGAKLRARARELVQEPASRDRRREAARGGRAGAPAQRRRAESGAPRGLSAHRRRTGVHGVQRRSGWRWSGTRRREPGSRLSA